MERYDHSQTRSEIDDTRDEVESSDGQGKEFAFPLDRLSNITLDRSPQWLIPDLMPARGLHVMYGAPGTGKSFLALSAALHIAAGRDWAGKKIDQADVLYIAAEGGKGFYKRVVAARQALDLPADTPFALMTRAPRLGGPKSQTEELIQDIRKQCRQWKLQPRLIVIDTLARTMVGLRESDSADMMEFVDEAQKISNAFDALVMPIHHSGKDETRGMRGSSCLHAAADAEWRLFTDESGARRLIIEKMKDGAATERLAYSLKSVALGDDEKGRAISSCIAEVYPDGSEAKDKTSDPVEEELSRATKTLIALRVLTALEGQHPPAQSAIRHDAKVVTFARLKDALVGPGLLPYDPPQNGVVALRRALKILLGKGLVARDGDSLWLTDGTSEG